MQGEETDVVADDRRAFAVYAMDEDEIYGDAVATYRNRLEDLAPKVEPVEQDAGTDVLQRYQFAADQGIRIGIWRRHKELDLNAAVTITAPMEAEVYEVLPENVFNDLNRHVTGIYMDDDLDTSVTFKHWQDAV